MHTPVAMPKDHSLPETRSEANSARAALLSEVLDIPAKLEKRTTKWFVIALVMLIFGMAGAALGYFQRQLLAMQVSYEGVRSENIALRDKLTDYLVNANISTTEALNRCTATLNETNLINRDVKALLQQLLLKRE